MKKPKKESVPLREGLFVEEFNKAFLLGSRCEICGRISLPANAFCLDCFSEKVKVVRLPNKGKLISFTTAHMPLAHFEPPYTVGWIDLEGIRIFAPIKVEKGQDIEIGMEVELVIDELWEEDGKKVMGPKFRPIC